MAKRKLRMTAFARFFLVMIIAAPLAYMGASYYNGEDGLQNLKDIFSGKFPSIQSTQVEEKVETEAEATIPIQEVEEKIEETNTPSEAAVNGEIARLKDELKYKDRRIQELYQEIEGLKIHLKEKDDALVEQGEKMEKIQKRLDSILKTAGGE